jgi:hypothetical protein
MVPDREAHNDAELVRKRLPSPDQAITCPASRGHVPGLAHDLKIIASQGTATRNSKIGLRTESFVPGAGFEILAGVVTRSAGKWGQSGQLKREQRVKACSLGVRHGVSKRVEDNLLAHPQSVEGYGMAGHGVSSGSPWPLGCLWVWIHAWKH